jgi:hypothetical protein
MTFDGFKANRQLFQPDYTACEQERLRFSLQDLKMPLPKDDPKSPEWRPYIFAGDEWHCRICGGPLSVLGDGTQTHRGCARRKHPAEHVRILQGRSLAAKENPII